MSKRLGRSHRWSSDLGDRDCLLLYSEMGVQQYRQLERFRPPEITDLSEPNNQKVNYSIFKITHLQFIPSKPIDL